MKRTVAGVLLLLTLGAGSLFADNGYSRRRDIRRDQVRIARDRRELRRDLYRGDYRAARNERRELRRDYRDLRNDRW